MPAKVIVQSGISAGAAHWIERPVLRVGSATQSDICLPSADVASHALTLEYREGVYRVYNRSQIDVLVGGKVITAGQVSVWNHGESVQLNDIELVLDVEVDPSPQPMQLADPHSGLDAELQEAAAGNSDIELLRQASRVPKKQSRLLEVVVIAVCVLGCIALLARERIKEDARPMRPSFNSVVRNAIASKGTSPQLVQRLQFAESAVIRGNKKSARERFGALRDDLLPQKDVFAERHRDPELAILDFVEYRLGQLD